MSNAKRPEGWKDCCLCCQSLSDHNAMPNPRSLEASDDGREPQHIPAKLPSLTALQYLVLELLSSQTGSVSAFQLKQGLDVLAPGYDGPKFYQLMGRLVRDGLVTAESGTIRTEGGTVERTFYASTKTGIEALVVTREFYTTRHRLLAILSGESTA